MGSVFTHACNIDIVGTTVTITSERIIIKTRLIFFRQLIAIFYKYYHSSAFQLEIKAFSKHAYIVIQVEIQALEQAVCMTTKRDPLVFHFLEQIAMA